MPRNLASQARFSWCTADLLPATPQEGTEADIKGLDLHVDSGLYYKQSAQTGQTDIVKEWALYSSPDRQKYAPFFAGAGAGSPVRSLQPARLITTALTCSRSKHAYVWCSGSRCRPSPVPLQVQHIAVGARDP